MKLQMLFIQLRCSAAFVYTGEAVVAIERSLTREEKTRNVRYYGELSEVRSKNWFRMLYGDKTTLRYVLCVRGRARARGTTCETLHHASRLAPRCIRFAHGTEPRAQPTPVYVPLATHLALRAGAWVW